MTPFSGTVYEDIMRLIVRKGDLEGSYWDAWIRHIETPFRPFSAYGWLLVVMTVMFASFVIHVVEDDSYTFEWQDVTTAAIQQLSQPGHEPQSVVRELIHGGGTCISQFR